MSTICLVFLASDIVKLMGLVTRMSLGHAIIGRKIGFANLDNICFMNSIMQCLSSVTPLVKISSSAYCKDTHSRSKHSVIFIREVGVALEFFEQ